MDEGRCLASCIHCGPCLRDCPFDTLTLAELGEDGPVTGTSYFTARDVPCEMCDDIPCVAACLTGALDPGFDDIDDARMGTAVLVDRENCLTFLGLRCDLCYRVCPSIDTAITLELSYNTRTDAHAIFEPTGHWPALTVLIGAGIVLAAYVLIAGRMYCSWVCLINPVTDAAHFLHRKLDLPKGWQPKREARLWIMGGVLVVSFVTGTIGWEVVSPITLLHRGLIFGMGAVWALVLGIFLFDLVVSRPGRCGHICPVGAFYGLIGQKSLLRVSAANRAACDDCMDCYAICPELQVISPALRGKGDGTPLILDSNGTNCGGCIDICAQNVFHFTHRFDDQIAAPEITSAPEQSAAR